jgi:hypothetical protein
LEHLPDPKSFIKDIGKLLKKDGVTLVTEAFKAVDENLPMHLNVNLKYAGLTYFLFSQEKLSLTWYSTNPLFKPLEFSKNDLPKKYWIMDFLKDLNLVRAFLSGRKRYWLQ